MARALGVRTLHPLPLAAPHSGFKLSMQFTALNKELQSEGEPERFVNRVLSNELMTAGMAPALSASRATMLGTVLTAEKAGRQAASSLGTAQLLGQYGNHFKTQTGCAINIPRRLVAGAPASNSSSHPPAGQALELPGESVSAMCFCFYTFLHSR